MGGASATLLAAVIGGLALAYQQHRHWRETRRDKLRDAYALWIGCLMALRRKDERVMESTELAFHDLNNRAHMGDPVAAELLSHGLRDVTADMVAARNEQHFAQQQEDIAFGSVLLLDQNRTRALGAQRVRSMQVFMPARAGEEPQSVEDFHRRWHEQEVALGNLALRVRLTLGLEMVPAFMWNYYEKRQAAKEQRLDMRLPAPARVDDANQ